MTDTFDDLGSDRDDFAPSYNPDDLAAALATGIPAGLVGVGIEPDDYGEPTRLTTVYASLASYKPDPKTDGLFLTFLVPRDHFYVALPLKDVRRKRLVLEVHTKMAETRGDYGKSAATKATPGQTRSQEIQARVKARHAERRFERSRRTWVGADGGAGPDNWVDLDDG